MHPLTPDVSSAVLLHSAIRALPAHKRLVLLFAKSSSEGVQAVVESIQKVLIQPKQQKQVFYILAAAMHDARGLHRDCHFLAGDRAVEGGVGKVGQADLPVHPLEGELEGAQPVRARVHRVRGASSEAKCNAWLLLMARNGAVFRSMMSSPKTGQVAARSASAEARERGARRRLWRCRWPRPLQRLATTARRRENEEENEGASRPLA